MTGKEVIKKAPEFLSFNSGALVIETNSVAAIVYINSGYKIYAAGNSFDITIPGNDIAKFLGDMVNEFQQLNNYLFVRKDRIKCMSIGVAKSVVWFDNGKAELSVVTSNNKYAKYNLEGLNVSKK